MLNLRCPRLAPWAAALFVLLVARPAAAQNGVPRQHGGGLYVLAAGSAFEVADLPHAERRLQKLDARLRTDVARGDAVAADRDVYRIRNTRFRIAVDDWLIRKNLCQQLGPYPNPVCLDAMSHAAISQYTVPPSSP